MNNYMSLLNGTSDNLISFEIQSDEGRVLFISLEEGAEYEDGTSYHDKDFIMKDRLIVEYSEGVEDFRKVEHTIKKLEDVGAIWYDVSDTTDYSMKTSASSKFNESILDLFKQ